MAALCFKLGRSVAVVFALWGGVWQMIVWDLV